MATPRHDQLRRETPGEIAVTLAKERQAVARRAARAAHECSSRAIANQPQTIMGKKASGECEAAVDLGTNRVLVDGWYVHAEIRPEDYAQNNLRFAGAYDVRAFEAEMKGGKKPARTAHSYEMHLFGAVRLFRHMQEGYETEARRIESLVADLTICHLFVSEAHPMTDGDIDTSIAALRNYDKACLADKKVVTKQLLTRARIAWTIRLLEEARQMPESTDEARNPEREFKIGQACAVYVSLKERLSTWRIDDIVGIKERAYQREVALRMERDRWLYRTVSWWAEHTDQLLTFTNYDYRTRLEILGTVEAYLNERHVDLDRLLRYIENNNDFFNAGDEHDRMHNRLRELYRTIRSYAQKIENMPLATTDEELQSLRKEAREFKVRALHQIEMLCLFVRSNKPDFVAAELAQSTEDAYLHAKPSRDGSGMSLVELVAFGCAAFERAREGEGDQLEVARRSFVLTKERMEEMGMDS